MKWITLIISSSWHLSAGGICKAASEHVVFKVDVLDAGKKGKHKDLSKFEEGKIAMATRLRRVTATPKLPLLWGVPGVPWSVSIKSGPRKEQWWTGNRVTGGQASLMHVGSEGLPVLSDPTDELLLLKLLKKLMPVQVSDTFRGLVESMPRRVRAVLAAKGGPTQY